MNKVARGSNWFERNPKKTIIVLVAICWVVFDMAAAQLLPRREIGTPSRYYHHDLKKSHKLNRHIESRRFTLYTNSLGFIDASNRTVPLKSDKFRILFMGDSFTEGIGYPYDQTFVGLLAKQMDPSVVEVLNAGVRSYSPKLYYLKTKYLIETLGLKFNHIYVLIDISDIQDEIAYENYVPGDLSYRLASCDVWLKDHFISYRQLTENIFAEALAGFRQKVFGTDDMIHAWGSRRDLWGNVMDYVRERGEWLTNEEVYNTWGKRGIELAQRNMFLLYQLCKQHGIGMTIVVYPWPYQVMHQELDSMQVKIWKDFAENLKVEFVNCFPYFIDQGDPRANVRKFFLANDVHWNNEGHILMVDIIMKSVSKIIPEKKNDSRSR